MDIVIHGLPRIVSISVEGQVAELSGPKSDARQVYHSNLGTVALHTRDVQVSFDDASVWVITSLTKAEARVARKRGWARLRLSEVHDVGTGYAVEGYLLCTPFTTHSVVLFRAPDTASFLASVPDDVSIADLSLPGTHDTCAFYGFAVSQCQQPSTPLSQQLRDGIRFLDIRCRVVKGELIIFHGVRNQRSKFTAVLSDLDDFLTTHPTETVVMSVKDEQRNENFSRLTWLDMDKYRHRWYFENRVPTLGEVRGKVIVLGRFWISPDDDNWEGGTGWGIPGWGAPTQDLRFDIGATKGRLQDWYTLSSFLQIPEKFAIIKRSLGPAEGTDTGPMLTISYASASGYPLSPPFAIAKGFGWPAWGLGIEGVNSRLEGWLARQLSEGKKVRGIVPLDFYRQDGQGEQSCSISELLILMNEL